MPLKFPLDRFPYVKHADSRPYTTELPPGIYVYVQDGDGTVWVLADGLHHHPKVLGGARPAAAAGELIINEDRVVVEVNNLSGTFRCGPETLEPVLVWLQQQGARIDADAEKGINLE
jgi:hypothetical protein